MNKETIETYNAEYLEKLSGFLNQNSDGVSADAVHRLSSECGLSREEAFEYLFAAALGLDVGNRAQDKEVFFQYVKKSVARLDCREYESDPYYKNIRFPAAKNGNWEFKSLCYKPYEVFVRDDFKVLFNGQLLPQIGYFTEEFSYPAVLENGVEWMTVTPNEINTMKPTLDELKGEVVTFGLGLGYFAYMASKKATVTRVIVVENNKNAIELFEKYVLPQFEEKSKINLIFGDAFDYLQNTTEQGFDYAFVDLWHDVSDGLPLYKRAKGFESRFPHTVFRYWIEPTIKYYL